MRKSAAAGTHWYQMAHAELIPTGFAVASGSHASPLAGRMTLSAEVMPELNRVVRGLAGQLHARLPQNCGIEMSDLIQAGNVGLLQAAGSFEPANGAPLGGYARFRIRGEMLDMVRRNASRPQASRHRTSEENDTEVDSIPSAAPESSPHGSITARQRAAIIDEELLRLPPRYRSVVRMRYGSEMTLREIGVNLKVNESRACQLHRSALDRLRKALSTRGVRQLAHL